MSRRRGFNVNTWRFKCECGHTHIKHNNAYSKCEECGCSKFRGFGLCMGCDGKWGDHETLFESEEERREGGRSTGEDFIPLAEAPGLQARVYRGSGSEREAEKNPELLLERGEITNAEYMDLITTIDRVSICKDKNKIAERSRQERGSGIGMKVVRSSDNNAGLIKKSRKGSEKMVRLMHESSGGTGKGRVVNRYGKFEK